MELISFTTSPSIAQRAISPAESLRGDRRLTIFAVTMPILLAAVSFVGPLLVTVVLMGILINTHTCWPIYLLASLWLKGRRRLPWRLMGFLDDAYRLGLLRVVGPSAWYVRACR